MQLIHVIRGSSADEPPIVENGCRSINALTMAESMQVVRCCRSCPGLIKSRRRHSSDLVSATSSAQITLSSYKINSSGTSSINLGIGNEQRIDHGETRTCEIPPRSWIFLGRQCEGGCETPSIEVKRTSSWGKCRDILQKLLSFVTLSILPDLLVVVALVRILIIHSASSTTMWPLLLLPTLSVTPTMGGLMTGLIALSPLLPSMVGQAMHSSLFRPLL